MRVKLAQRGFRQERLCPTGSQAKKVGELFDVDAGILID
jgi:hypothetical protein